jgi:two-component system KDP operon response regulator KdpE
VKENNMPHKIIVIEDDADQSKPFIETLTHNKDYDIIHAFNGIDGVAAVVKHTPDLVIVDLLLVQRGDEMDGFDVIKAIRCIPDIKTIGILAWTSHFVKRQDEIRALRAGADDFINKDADFAVIEARIEAILRRVNRTQS